MVPGLERSVHDAHLLSLQFPGFKLLLQVLYPLVLECVHLLGGPQLILHLLQAFLCGLRNVTLDLQRSSAPSNQRGGGGGGGGAGNNPCTCTHFPKWSGTPLGQTRWTALYSDCTSMFFQLHVHAHSQFEEFVVLLHCYPLSLYSAEGNILPMGLDFLDCENVYCCHPGTKPYT